MSELRRRRWLAGLALFMAVASTLGCGGMEYAMVSPDSDLLQQIKDEIARVWSAVKSYVENILHSILELVGLADRGSSLELGIVSTGDRGRDRELGEETT